MAVRNLKTFHPIFWIPPTYGSNHKITIERADGTVDDVTDIVESFSFSDVTTEGIGNFSLSLLDGTGTYVGRYTGMEIVRLYIDYMAGSPVTLRWRGRNEKPASRSTLVQLGGRTEGLFYFEKTATLSVTDVDAGTIIKDLFDDKTDGRYTTPALAWTTGVLITNSWVDQPIGNIIQDICNASAQDCYVDCNLAVQLIPVGSRNNTQEGAVHDQNILDVGEFASDITKVKNQIRVYGSTVEGVQIIYTANDATSQTLSGIRRLNYSDEGITAMDAAITIGEAVLAQQKNIATVGDVTTCTMLATVQPADTIFMSDPINNIPPAYYRVLKYEHNFSRDGELKTILTINKESSQKLAQMMKDRVLAETKQQSTTSNAFDMNYSEIETFASNSGTHTNTQIAGGVLSATVAGGVWLSALYPSRGTAVISQVVLNVQGSNLPNITFEVSANGGINYQTVTPGTLTTLTQAIGTSLKFRITFATTSGQLDSFSIQY